jgi:uncharacterized protein
MHLSAVFATPKPVIGMLHVPALPGSPRNELEFPGILDWVLKDAAALAESGIDGCVIENFGDVPFYPGRVPTHILTFMTLIAAEVKRRFGLPLGVNILRNDAESAIAIAAAVDAEFIRVNIHSGARLTDQGLIEGKAHDTLRYRRFLNSKVKIFADVDSKHSAPVAVRDLKDEVDEVLSRGCADAVIVTGAATGRQTSLDDLRQAKQAAGDAPVLAGSGVEAQSVAEILSIADGVIVGTSIKENAVTTNPIDVGRVRALMKAAGRR